MLINICSPEYCTDCGFHFSPLSSQFCASSAKEAEEWVKQIDFVLKGLTSFSQRIIIVLRAVRNSNIRFVMNELPQINQSL